MLNKLLSKVFGRKEMMQTIDITELDSMEEHERFWETLQFMYERFLHADPKWHFFYEGNYNHIRCQKSFMEKVTKVLETNGFDFTEPVVWEDSSATVRAYEEEFTSLFHNFSEIAMKFQNSNDTQQDKLKFESISDRIIHCFLNHMYYRAMTMYEETDYQNTEYELHILGNLFKSRAWYIGMCNGVWKANAHWEKKIEEARKREEQGKNEIHMEAIN